MKAKHFLLLSLFAAAVVALWWAEREPSAVRSEAVSESVAVREATQALEFYLPRFVDDPGVSRFIEPPMNPGLITSDDPVLLLRHRERDAALLRAHVEATERTKRGMLDELDKVSGQRYRGFTGSGYVPPIWNIQGHHYLTADRTADFETGAIALDVVVVHPRVYQARKGSGFEIQNDPAQSGVSDVGHLTIAPQAGEWMIWISHPGVHHGYSTNAENGNSGPGQSVTPKEAALVDLIAEGPVTRPDSGHRYCVLVSATTDAGPLHWTDAQRVAEALGGHLVVVDDEREQRWIEANFLRERNLWIGLRDLDRNGLYGWVNSESSSYQNWAPGEPSSANEPYVHMWSDQFRRGQGGMWNDSSDIFFEVQGLVEFPPGWTLPDR